MQSWASRRTSNLPTVAEGIEDLAVLLRLAAKGCEFGQGYYTAWGSSSRLIDCSSLLFAQSGAGHRIGEPRARDIGIPFDGTPGPLKAISDVASVKVGYKTLISGEGKTRRRQGTRANGRHSDPCRVVRAARQGLFAGFFFRQWQRSSRCRFLAAGAKRMGSRLTGPRASAWPNCPAG